MNNFLSKRLKEVSKFVDKNSKIVDVGSDHAYLPISLVENHVINNAIASEVAKGPMNRSIENIIKHNLQDNIQVRLGDGLEKITENDSIDTVVIAGMGGILIRDILQRFVDRNEFIIPKLILQPNIGEPEVRKWLEKNNYKISNENIIEDEHHTYEIIVGEKSDNIPSYSREDLLLGPVLKTIKNDAFINKWSNKLNKYEDMLKKISRSKSSKEDKINELKMDIAILRRLLNG